MPERKCLAEVWLDEFFDPAPRMRRSFRECYVKITGDKNVTGEPKNCSAVALRESLDSTSWASALSASINRRMVAEYRRGREYSVWRKLVKIAGNVNDFRDRTHVRFGGYGDLPIVGESDPYLALPSPTDEKASYAVTKRGGTEDITREMVKNDDIGTIRRIPERLAQAAHRTLGHFVLDFLRTNPVIYDGVPLFHATHANLGNGVLSSGALAAARAAMAHQTELGSGDQLRLKPRFLWVPVDLEETGVNLFRRGANQDKTFVQNLDIEVVPVWYWTDVDDWCVSADPEECPTIEVAFLDGLEEPESFAQDTPNAGAMFSHDKMTFKIRHTYGGAVIDYRPIYKSIV